MNIIDILKEEQEEFKNKILELNDAIGLFTDAM